MTRVYVGIGTNVDRARQVRHALDALRARFGPVRTSRVYESAAEGACAAPAYYNLVATFDTDLAPGALVGVLREIERSGGRDRSAGATPGLDLDLLLFGDLVDPDGPGRVPREDIVRHAFVLGPLAELEPALRHPVLGETMAALWARFEGPGRGLAPVEVELPEIEP